MSLLFCLLFLYAFPSDPSLEAEEYAVEGKTDALLLGPSDGFP